MLRRRPTSSTRNGWQMPEMREKVFMMFEVWIFFLQKRMDSLQEVFIHPPEPCEARFIMWTVDCSTETPAHRNDNAMTIFYITQRLDWIFNITQMDALRVSKSQANFHFWVN